MRPAAAVLVPRPQARFSRAPGVILISGCLALFSAAQAEESPLLKQLESHLASPRQVERDAAYRCLALCPSRAAAEFALRFLEKETAWRWPEWEGLYKLMAQLPLERLQLLLAATHPVLAQAGVYGLEHLPTETLAPVLKNLLDDPREAVRDRAAEVLSHALIRIPHQKPPEGYDRLVELSPRLVRIANELKRAEVVRRIGASQALTPRIVKELAKDTSAGVREALAWTLGYSVGSAEGFAWCAEPLLDMARDAEPKVQLEALKGIRWSHERAGLVVRQTYQERMLEILKGEPGILLPEALAFFETYAIPEAAPELERLASSTAQGVAARALRALKTQASPKLADLAFAACALPGQDAKDAAIQILKELGDGRLAAVAAKAAKARLAPVDSSSLDLLANSEAGLDLATLTAARLAGLNAEDSQRLVRRLVCLDPVERLQECERIYGLLKPDGRRALMRTFGYGIAAEYGTTFMTNRLKDPHPEIRLAAWSVFKPGPDIRGTYNMKWTVLPLVEALEALQDSDERIVRAALDVLEVLGLPFILRRGVDRLTQSKNAGLRMRALEWARQIGYWEAQLEAALKDPESKVRSRALQCVGPYAWDHPEVRRQLLDPLNGLYEPPAGVPLSPEGIEAVCQAAEQAPRERKAYFFSILARVDHERARESLRKFAENSDRGVRWAALDALAEQGDTSDAVLDHALARILTASVTVWKYFRPRPALVPKLLERLETLKPFADAARFEKIRTTIQQALQAVQGVGGALR